MWIEIGIIENGRETQALWNTQSEAMIQKSLTGHDRSILIFGNMKTYNLTTSYENMKNQLMGSFLITESESKMTEHQRVVKKSVDVEQPLPEKVAAIGSPTKPPQVTIAELVSTVKEREKKQKGGTTTAALE